MLINSKNATGSYWFFGDTLMSRKAERLLSQRSRPHSPSLTVGCLVAVGVIGVSLAAMTLRKTLSPVPLSITLLAMIVVIGVLFAHMNFIPQWRAKRLNLMQQGGLYELRLIHESHPLFVYVQPLIADQTKTTNMAYAGAISDFFAKYGHSREVFDDVTIQTAEEYDAFMQSLDVLIADTTSIVTSHATKDERDALHVVFRGYREARVVEVRQVIIANLKAAQRLESAARADVERYERILADPPEEVDDEIPVPVDAEVSADSAVTSEVPLVIVSNGNVSAA